MERIALTKKSRHFIQHQALRCSWLGTLPLGTLPLLLPLLTLDTAGDGSRLRLALFQVEEMLLMLLYMYPNSIAEGRLK